MGVLGRCPHNLRGASLTTCARAGSAEPDERVVRHEDDDGHDNAQPEPQTAKVDGTTALRVHVEEPDDVRLDDRVRRRHMTGHGVEMTGLGEGSAPGASRRRGLHVEVRHVRDIGRGTARLERSG